MLISGETKKVAAVFALLSIAYVVNSLTQSFNFSLYLLCYDFFLEFSTAGDVDS